MFLLLAVATVVLGLAVHLRGGMLPPEWRDVLGDVLWAMMIVWYFGLLMPGAPRAARGVAALATCITVELSQLLHAPALDAVRRGYDPRDFLAYALGVAGAVLLERFLITRLPANEPSRASLQA
jgi:hypothetical protein